MNRHVTATTLMSAPVKSFHFLPTVKEVYYALISTPYNGFPVINGTQRLIGLVERDVLITLLEKKCWYEGEGIKVMRRVTNMGYDIFADVIKPKTNLTFVTDNHQNSINMDNEGVSFLDVE